MIRARPRHRRSICAIFATNTDVQILSEAPSPASALLKKPDKNKSACSRGMTCKRLKFGWRLPHLGASLTPSVELTTWYLVAPHSLLQPRRQRVSLGAAAL
jgi:hypothetical protein